MVAPWKQKAGNSGGSGEGFEKPPIDNHPAVLVAIVDMGTQRQEFQGTEKWQRRAYFIWELVSAPMSGTKNRNHLIGIDLTVSLNEKAKLRQWIESRKGKKMPEDFEYDITQELGQSCLLDVIANKKGYPVVNGMKALPRGFTIQPAQNQPFQWSLDDYEKEGDIDLPDWVEAQWLYGRPISEHIKECKELSGKPPAGAEVFTPSAGKADDPIPF
jgi:hypothetical protein